MEEWNDLNMDVEEKNHFSKNNFIVFKLKYNTYYITVLLDTSGTVLLKKLSSKDKILNIDLIGRSNTRSGGVKVFFKSSKSLTTPPTMYKFAL